MDNKEHLPYIFRLVKKYFALEYGYAGSSIELSNSYQNTINSYV